MKLAHPWRTLRDLQHIDLIWTDLPLGVRGATDGLGRIWVDRQLLQRERRCTLAHELVHIRRRHTEPQPEAVERSVDREAARWLLPDIKAVGESLAWAHNLHEAADDLWVTDRFLTIRLEAAHPSEVHYLRERLARAER